MTLTTMTAFAPYVQSLEDLLQSVHENYDDSCTKAVAYALDGQASTSLRELVKADTRKASGAYFTSATLRKAAVSRIASTINANSIIYDPSCGAGDLLVECSRFLQICGDAYETVQAWGRQLSGVDLYPEFVQSAKIRLALAALSRIQMSGGCIPDEPFSSVRVGDGLSNQASIQRATHIIMNPPYCMCQSSSDLTWASGSVSLAAVFVAECIAHASTGAQLVALLPDVLRTGTRYARWRDHISRNVDIREIRTAGRFDKTTDIDVFLLHMTIGGKQILPSAWWGSECSTAPEKRFSDYFDIHVGPVVPHRHTEQGQVVPFLCARKLSGFDEYDSSLAPKRAFSGRTFTPPFVVVRRTTRPGIIRRIVGTLVTGSSPVAVENHLVVLKPKSEGLAICQIALQQFDDPRTREWLDDRIRCRHFTVTSLKELPWWEKTP